MSHQCATHRRECSALCIYIYQNQVSIFGFLEVYSNMNLPRSSSSSKPVTMWDNWLYFFLWISYNLHDIRKCCSSSTALEYKQICSERDIRFAMYFQIVESHTKLVYGILSRQPLHIQDRARSKNYSWIINISEVPDNYYCWLISPAAHFQNVIW